MVRGGLLGLLLLTGGGDSVTDALKWLTRHQAEDGSWGAPRSCTCILEAKPAPPAKADNEKAAPLIDRLAHPDPEERESASKALFEMREAALPAIEKAATADDVEVRGRAIALLRQFQRPASSSKVRATSLALLAFLGAGYSHLSKNKHDGRCFGETVKNGLKWLLKEQNVNGQIGDAGEHAFATLALCEAYGLTGSQLFKDHTQKAVDRLWALRAQPRGWGDDTVATTWATMAFKSAEISGLDVNRACYDHALAWLNSVTSDDGRAGMKTKGDFNPKTQSHDTATACAMLARIFIEKNKNEARLIQGAKLVAGQTEATDVLGAYFTGLALFQYDGPQGAAWKSWWDSYRKAAVPLQAGARECDHGAWPVASGLDRVSATALYALSLEVYSR